MRREPPLLVADFAAMGMVALAFLLLNPSRPAAWLSGQRRPGFHKAGFFRPDHYRKQLLEIKEQCENRSYIIGKTDSLRMLPYGTLEMEPRAGVGRLTDGYAATETSRFCGGARCWQN